MLRDGEPESRPSEFPAAALIHSIEPLEDPIEVLAGDAVADRSRPCETGIASKVATAVAQTGVLAVASAGRWNIRGCCTRGDGKQSRFRG